MLLDEIGAQLSGLGLVGGASGWTLAKGYVPPDPDHVVTLFETPGQPPEAAVDMDHVGFQVRVRGSVKEYDVARAQLESIYAALHKLTGTLSGTYYVSILASSGPLPLGEDQSERPEIVQNYLCQRSRS